MYGYLAKKIAIPKKVPLRCVSWNLDHGWVACGGENNLLKVIQLDGQEGKKGSSSSAAAGGSLTMNQSLEGHSGAVIGVTWNEVYRKLTSSDENGLIIVWMLHKGTWYEEMINSRNKSVVTDMMWTADGRKICIVYEDGAVIAGSVEGNRLWGKETNLNLSAVCWAPDGRWLLFGCTNGEVYLYDGTNGSPCARIPMSAIDEGAEPVRIVSIKWYDGTEGYPDVDAPYLAIGFENGRVQLMRHETDEKPIILVTDMKLEHMEWNPFGTMLAISGPQTVRLSSGERKVSNTVEFYSPYGQHLHTLRVPGTSLSGISWEGSGLRMALGVDSFVYFANVCNDYHWGYFGKCIVYAFTKPDRLEQCVIFWNTKSNEKYVKYVKKLLQVRAGGEHCCLATRDEKEGEYILILCNAIGSPMDSRYIQVEPIHMCMTDSHVVVASENTIYFWSYKAQASSFLRRETLAQVKCFNVDDPEGGLMATDLYVAADLMTHDVISSICSSTKYLIVARASGTVQVYAMGTMALLFKFQVDCRPHAMYLNCTSSRLAIIDFGGSLTFVDLFDGGSEERHRPVEGFVRKDVWSFTWSEDNPELFATMEKQRMYVFRDTDPEEPVLSSSYICRFKNLKIKAVNMNELMRDPDFPNKKYLIDFSTRSLRDTAEMLENQDISIQDCFSFIEKNSHPRLWKLLADKALDRLDFLVAEQAFVRSRDYQGIDFVKRLKVLGDPNKQRAEVATYFKRFDEAEEIYRDIDRKDLAVELRKKLGMWFRVSRLVQEGVGDDTTQLEAANNLGHYFAERQKWSTAVQHFQQAKNLDMLVDCYYRLDDFDSLWQLAEDIPESDGSPILTEIGNKFRSIGMCDHAVQCFLKANQTKLAVDTCVELNQWTQAVELAKRFNFREISSLLSKYASHLLESNNTIKAIELYQNAGHHSDAAKLLVKLASDSALRGHALRAKKIHVLAAMEEEQLRRKLFESQSGSSAGHGSRGGMSNALAGLMALESTSSSMKPSEVGWKGAEAFHFFMLAQTLLFQGNTHDAMRVSLRLREYEDVLPTRDTYNLIALSCFLNQHYGQCSKAFIKLENLGSLSPEERSEYKRLAVRIFTKNSPVDPASGRVLRCPECSSNVEDWVSDCGHCGHKFTPCIVSGKCAIHQDTHQCPNCHRVGLRAAFFERTSCPLCHFRVVM